MILELTPVKKSTAMPVVIRLLRGGKYLGRIREQRHEHGGLVGASSAIFFGGRDAYVDVAFPRVEISNEAYEAATRVPRCRGKQRAREDLEDLCVEIASAAEAEGFRLRFDDAPSATLLHVEALVDAFVEGGGLVYGFREGTAAFLRASAGLTGWRRTMGFEVYSSL